MIVNFCSPKRLNFGTKTHFCGGVESTFVLSGAHFSPPCVGFSFPCSASAANESRITLRCALIGLYLTSLLSMGSLRIVSTSWWMQSESA